MALNDIHCHFFSRAFFETLARPIERFANDTVDQVTGVLGWDTPGSPEHLADRWVTELDRHHVGRAAVIASVPGDEDSVAAALKRHPDRLVGFFMLDAGAEDAPDRTRTALGAKGLRGVCLFPAMHRFRLDGPQVGQVLDAAASQAGAVVFVHCGMLSVGVRGKLGLPSPFDIRLGNPLDLVPGARSHPDLTFIIPHFGAGFFREALMAADLCPNICFDTSSSNSWVRYCGLNLSQAYDRALQVLGPRRLVFGSDSSFFPRGWNRPVYDAQTACIEQLGIPEEDRRLIFAGNFQRLFPLP